jgi:hypothetical protein
MRAKRGMPELTPRFSVKGNRYHVPLFPGLVLIHAVVVSWELLPTCRLSVTFHCEHARHGYGILNRPHRARYVSEGLKFRTPIQKQAVQLFTIATARPT